MELRQLKQFLAVVEHRNFGRAADALGVTQQALSYSVAQLEKSVGAKLLQRGQFGAELTESGLVLRDRAQLVAAELEIVRDEIDALRGGAKGHVRIGVAGFIADRLLPKAINRFADRCAGVGVSVAVNHSKMLFQSLLTGDIDFAVTAPFEPIDHYTELKHEPGGRDFKFDLNFLCMRVGHPLARRRDPKLADMRAFRWVMPATFASFQHRLLELFHHADVASPDFILRTDSVGACKSLLLQSDFVALLGREQIVLEAERRLLCGLPVPGLEGQVQGYFSYRKRFPLRPAALRLLQVFRDVVQERSRTTS